MSKLLFELPLDSAERFGDRPCLTLKGRTVDYAFVATQIERFASALIRLGSSKLARVAVYLPKQPETVITMFGAARAGCAFVPVNPDPQAGAGRSHPARLQRVGARHIAGTAARACPATRRVPGPASRDLGQCDDRLEPAQFRGAWVGVGARRRHRTWAPRRGLPPPPRARPPASRARPAPARRGGPCRARATRAASRRSESRPFVHEPMKATSILVPAMRSPALPSHVLVGVVDGRALVARRTPPGAGPPRRRRSPGRG